MRKKSQASRAINASQSAASLRVDSIKWSRSLSSDPTFCKPPSSSLIGSVPISRLTDRKSTRLNSSHVEISYAVFCLKKKKNKKSLITKRVTVMQELCVHEEHG